MGSAVVANTRTKTSQANDPLKGSADDGKRSEVLQHFGGGRILLVCRVEGGRGRREAFRHSGLVEHCTGFCTRLCQGQWKWQVQ